PGGIGGGSTDSAKQVNISQETFEDHVYADGVFDVAPMQGIAVWNSHAFNLTQGDTTMNQYFNLWLAGPTDQQYTVQEILASRVNFSHRPLPPWHQRMCQ